jgi:integrase/recombinase XerD
MLSKFFKCPVRLQELRCSPAGSSLEGFAHSLWQSGYAEATAQRHIRVAEHFVYWTDRKGIAPAALNESCIASFEHHLHRCRCPRYGCTYPLDRQNGVGLFLRYLCDAGVATDSVAAQTVPVEPVLLTAFLQWMRQQRGTSDRTLNNYSFWIRDLLKNVGDDPQPFNARNLRKFVLERTRQSGWGAAKLCATGVRMFLRFLTAEGHCPAGLAACIPTGAHWRLSPLPQYLQPEDVERIIDSCDRVTPVGRRDYTILLLLARMGFRASDVACLHLEDIDWEQAWIHVSGKGRRQTRLPLTKEVGAAIAAYLLHGRPRCVSDKLFVRARAPFGDLRSQCAVSMIVTRAMHRAKVTCPSRGAAHLLRHSSATSMLRHGASLQEIAVILRHRSIQTTEIYAKVDVAALGAIAQQWPEVQQC